MSEVEVPSLLPLAVRVTPSTITRASVAAATVVSVPPVVASTPRPPSPPEAAMPIAPVMPVTTAAPSQVARSARRAWPAPRLVATRVVSAVPKPKAGSLPM